MRLLLDTHTILWMISDDPRLSQRARDAIRDADEIHWSLVSLWEIGIKLSLDQSDFRLGPGWARLIPEEMSRNGIQPCPLSPQHCEAVARLPWHHRDPFDRLLIATASIENFTLLSRDGNFSKYPVDLIW